MGHPTSSDAILRLKELQPRHPQIHKAMSENQYAEVLFKPEDVSGISVMDVGAHVGFFSLLCLSHGATCVTSVEANPKTFLELQANLAGFDSVRLVNRAVTDGRTPSVRFLLEDAQSMVVNASFSGANVLGEEVATTTLDDLTATMQHGERVLKVDVEGSEYGVLLGASSSTIRSFRTIFLETHPSLEPGPGRSYGFLNEYMLFMGFKETSKSQQFAFRGMNNIIEFCEPIKDMVNSRYDRG